MGKIRVTEISAAPLEALYAAGKQAETLATHAPSLKRIRVLEETPGREHLKTEWSVRFKILTFARNIKLLVDAEWDDAERCCRFGLNPDYKGAVSKMDGTWRFEPHPRGTRMTVDLDVGVNPPIKVSSGLAEKIADDFVKTLNADILKGVSKSVQQNIANSK